MKAADQSGSGNRIGLHGASGELYLAIPVSGMFIRTSMKKDILREGLNTEAAGDQ